MGDGGASKDIGAGTFYALSARGAFALIHYSPDRQGACRVLETIRTTEGHGELVQSGLSTSEGIHRFIHTFDQDGRTIDILVNNAGSSIKRGASPGLNADRPSRQNKPFI